MKKVMIIIVSVFVLYSARANAVDVTKSFLQANEAYETGDNQKAIELYTAMVLNVKNGNLYFNLGNSYFKDGKIGLALANYLRAKKYLSENSDLNDNIAYLKTMIKDNIEDKSAFSTVKKIFFFYEHFNTKEFFHLFLIFNVLFFLFLTVRLYLKKDIFVWLRNLLFFMLVLSLIGIIINYKTYYYDETGVVISGEISVKSGSSINDTTLFNLHEGTECQIIDENDNWYKIRLLDNKKGWVLKKVIEVI